MTPSTTPLGQVIDANTLRMQRTLAAQIDTVWNFLVDPERRMRWLAGGSRPAEGARFELRFDNDALTGETTPPRFRQFAGVHCMASRVIAMQAPKLLVMSWQEGSPNESEVRFELEPRGDHTQLTLTHSRLARREGMLNVAGGWHAHLDVLEDVLAERAPRPFWTNFGEKEAAYDRLIPAAS